MSTPNPRSVASDRDRQTAMTLWSFLMERQFGSPSRSSSGLGIVMLLAAAMFALLSVALWRAS